MIQVNSRWICQGHMLSICLIADLGCLSPHPSVTSALHFRLCSSRQQMSAKRRRQNLFDGCSASTPASAASSEVARRKTVHQAWEKTLWTAVKKETQSQAGTETPMNLRSSTFIRLSARFTNPAPSQIHHPALSQMCPMMMLGLPTGAFHESTLTQFLMLHMTVVDCCQLTTQSQLTWHQWQFWLTARMASLRETRIRQAGLQSNGGK